MTTNFVVSSRYLKTEPNEVVIDPIMSGVAHIRKQIGDQVYEAYLDSRLVKENCIPCFPDGPPKMDAYPIPLPQDWEPRKTRSILVGGSSWTMPAEDFDKLEWVDLNQRNIFRGQITPNEQTLDAIADAANGNLVDAGNIRELMEELNQDD